MEEDENLTKPRKFITNIFGILTIDDHKMCLYITGTEICSSLSECKTKGMESISNETFIMVLQINELLDIDYYYYYY
jgi:hypothetical protein